MTEQSSGPRYEGVTKYIAKQDGYALWVPSDWHRFKMHGGHRGVIFSPYADDYNTSFSAEKVKLQFNVGETDVPALREGFNQGLQSLPGIDIESQDETTGQGIMSFDARLTFLEGSERRKRWIRVIYASNAQLTLIAQGRTVDDFEYWLPMFYNTMMTIEI
jgi:hypothetical protein